MLCATGIGPESDEIAVFFMETGHCMLDLVTINAWHY